MHLVTGYDRPMAEQFFRRSISSLLNEMEEGQAILPEETDYLASRFGETVFTSLSQDLAFPKFLTDVAQLINASAKQPLNREISQQAELAANLLLFREGMCAFGALHELKPEHLHPVWWDRRPIEAISALYGNAAAGKFRNDAEGFVLRQLARNAPEWVILLGHVPGASYMELLQERPSTNLVLPTDA